jgi:predicted Zn-dependent protease
MKSHSPIAIVLFVLAAFCSGSNLRAHPAPQLKPSHSDEDLNAIGQRDVGKGVNLFSLDKEQALGKQLAQAVERSSRLLADPVVTDYVNRLLQKIAANSDARVPVSVRVIESEVVNGFVLPGGFLYVNTGLILQVNGEAELAGVLARGIAHTAMRSSTKEATKGRLMELATVPTTMQLSTFPLMLLGPGGWGGYGNYQGFDLSIAVTYLKFQRDSQRAADFYGLEYLYKSGYDPECLLRFLERSFSPTSAAKKIPQAFSEYPPLPERLESMNKEIARILPHQDGAIITTAEFQLVQDRLRALKLREIVGPPAIQGKPTLRKPSDTPPPGPPPLTPNRQQNLL